jgi:hypothetical protein
MSMRRCFLIGLLALLALTGLVASAAGASGRVKATLTRIVQPGPPGTHVVVAVKLRDASGRLVLEKHVFVKITCPEGDRSTVTYANPNTRGTYVVNAIVPAGGVGSVTVGHGASVYPVTNPFQG